jgi:hypothetical protein
MVKRFSQPSFFSSSSLFIFYSVHPHPDPLPSKGEVKKDEFSFSSHLFRSKFKG